MKVLGISAHFHDASAALMVDGHIVAAAAEERFSRVKHDANFPEYAARFCLAQGQIHAGDLDAVVFYERPAVKFTRVLASTVAGFPWSRASFTGAMKSWLSYKLFLRNEISKRLGVHPRSVEFVSHHQSHAAHAFYSSPFDHAAILTIDAVGEWSCTSLAMGERRPERPGDDGIRELESTEYPHSLGLVYAAFTAFLGFKPNSGECSTMALSAFGRPSRVDDVRQVLRVASDGTYSVETAFFDFMAGDEKLFTSRFSSLFGEPATPGFLAGAQGLDALADNPSLDPEVQRYADIAASLQVVLEEAIVGLARRLHEQTGATNLCFAGGVALNCVANSRLLHDGPFDSIFIPPDPGDGGGAIGAALAFCGGGIGGGTPYLGRAYGDDEAAAMVPFVDRDVWDCVGPGASATRAPQRVTVESFDDDGPLFERVIDRIRGGGIVGWVQGRFENGPRALGNRSLLADPSSLETARRMSQTVKLRAPFRPYSFSVAEAHAPRVIDDRLPHEWMQFVANVPDAARASLRAACHADGTTRPQICTQEANPRYHRLLEMMGQASGTSALLNTSLNERGAPMVASPVEALAMFARTDMDALVLGRHWVLKEW